MEDKDNQDQGKSLTRDELAELTLRPFVVRMEHFGLTEDYLIKKLKRELNAKESKNVKVKGAVTGETLGNSRRVVATSGTLAYDKEGQVFGDGDSLIEWDEVAWQVRQKARQDAHKLRGDYPVERQEISVTGAVLEQAIQRARERRDKHEPTCTGVERPERGGAGYSEVETEERQEEGE